MVLPASWDVGPVETWLPKHAVSLLRGLEEVSVSADLFVQGFDRYVLLFETSEAVTVI